MEKIRESSRRISRFRRGDLAAAGLGEVAHYLKKAKQNIAHATFSLEHADFEEAADVLKGEDLSVESLIDRIAAMISAIHRAEGRLIVLAEEKEEKDV